MSRLLEPQHVEIAQLMALSMEQRLSLADDHRTTEKVLRVLTLDVNPLVRSQAFSQLVDRKGQW